MEHGSILSVWIILHFLFYYTSATFDAALHKTCSQSSTYHQWVAEFAVDGIIDALATCTHTAPGDSNNWWQVDLAGVYWVQSVLVRNRGDGIETERLRDFTVSVLMDSSSQGTVCATYEGHMPKASVETLFCDHEILGRYVKISKPSSGPLTLCEVQVLVNPRPKVVFEQQMKKTIDADFHSETEVADFPSCAEYCMTLMGCYAFGYNRATDTCRRYITSILSNTTNDEFIFFTRID